MKSVFSNKRPQTHLQRNAFDLTHSDVFSISPGMLLPIHVQEVNPNEHFEFSPSAYVRTMPLNTAAFVRAKQHIEFFFVPMRVLARQWNQFIVGTDYKISSVSALNNYTTIGVDFNLLDVAKWFGNNYASSSEFKNIFGLPFAFDAVRLFDMLGYGVNSHNVKQFVSVAGTKLVNIFRLLAYQKVYYDHYRNPLYEVNDPSAYNVDQYFGTNKHFVGNDLSAKNDFMKMCTLRYRNWSKDYFTCANPQWQGADYLTQPTNIPLSIIASDGIDSLTTQSEFNGDWYDDNGRSLPSTGAGAQLKGDLASGALTLNVANLRAAFAYDKMLRLSISAGDGDYGSQIQAHYGFNAVHDDWKSKFIGGCTSALNISEVVTTATTEQAPTGDICGKGVSYNEGRFSFDTREHGIIIGIMSIVPQADYQSSGVDSFNMKSSREQYFQPEFADLGKQPLSSHELNLIFESSGSTPAVVKDNSILGFVPRYMEYKTAIDKVHGQFVNGGSLSAWAAPRNNPTIQVGDNDLFTSTSLKVDPRIFNPIVTVIFDGQEITDQFVVDASTVCHAIRPMSVTGEPML
mgnify:CR=1 FL=1